MVRQAKTKKEDVQELIVANNLLKDEQLGQLVAEELGFLFLDLKKEKIDEAVLRLIPEIVARSKGVVAIARENPDLPVGIHLSLVWGRPVSDPARIPTLVDREGRLNRSAGALGVRAVLGRISVDQVKIEFASQVRKVLDAGLTPTHLDTHKHIHVLPGLHARWCRSPASSEFARSDIRGSDRPSRGGAVALRRAR